MTNKLTLWVVDQQPMPFFCKTIETTICEKKIASHMLFEKAFDRFPSELIPWDLRQQRNPKNMLRLLICLYTGSKSRTRRPQGCSDYFKIKVGEFQVTALSLLLFIKVMEEVRKNCRSRVLWDTRYADELVSAETEPQSNEKLNN